MASLSQVVGTSTTTNIEQIVRDNNLFTDTAGNLGYTENDNRYIPLLYAKKVLYDFYKATLYTEVTNTDYEGQFKSMGDRIVIRTAPNTGDPTAYTKGLALTYDTPSADAQEMVIDQAFYQAFVVEDVDKVQMDVGLMDMYVQDASNRMRTYVDKVVQTAMSTGMHANNAGATAGVISSAYNLGVNTAAGAVALDRTNALDKLVDLSSVLSEQNVDTMNRFVIIPEWYANRLKLSDLKAADFSGDSTAMVRTGLIGSINGMKIYVNNNNPTVTNAYPIIAGLKMATSFALQMSKVDTLTAESTFGQKWRTLWVFGVKAVRPEGLAVMYANPA